ncbi:MAG: prepilin-type N-terminal cleavage/methylation domain-containing protein [Myxococcales bacterium FL481]|nr:MAG: prepilin-type N-terminal cleavage/methylation domain-containing protein [Myxococcales bacterium FL481]
MTMIFKRSRPPVPAGSVGTHRQKLPSRRRECSHYGFTLIEMMVVLAVISIVAAVTFSGAQKEQYEGAFRRFGDDLQGSVTRARHLAIDEQTQVMVEVSRDGFVVSWVDPTTAQTEDRWQTSREAVQGGMLAVGERACLYGVYAGVVMFDDQVASSMSAAPNACLSGTETLRFFPDGHLEWDGQILNGAGITVVLADRRTGKVRETHLQIFPGGLIRRIDNVVASG